MDREMAIRSILNLKSANATRNSLSQIHTVPGSDAEALGTQNGYGWKLVGPFVGPLS